MNPHGEQEIKPILTCKCGFPAEPVQKWILHFGWCPRMLRHAVEQTKRWRSCG